MRIPPRALVALKLLIGVALLALVLQRVDVSALSGLTLEKPWLTLALALALVVIVLKALRWQSVLRTYFGHRLPYQRSLKVLFIGQAFSLLTPSRAGDFVRAGYVQPAIGLRKALLSVAIGSLMDGVILLSGGGIAIIVFSEVARSLRLSGTHGAVALLLGFLLIVVLALAWNSSPGAKARAILKELLDIMARPLRGRSFLPAGYQWLLTFVCWVLTTLASYASARALGLHVEYLPFALLLMLQSVLLLLPITVLGLGIREGTSYALYPLVGIPRELTVPAVWLATFFLSVVPALIGAGFYLLDGAIRQDIQKQRPRSRTLSEEASPEAGWAGP